MNYADALVDRGVCAQGLRFFSLAFKTSSFASVVVKLRSGGRPGTAVLGERPPPAAHFGGEDAFAQARAYARPGVRTLECLRGLAHKVSNSLMVLF